MPIQFKYDPLETNSSWQRGLSATANSYEEACSELFGQLLDSPLGMHSYNGRAISSQSSKIFTEGKRGSSQDLKISEVISMPECHWVRAHLIRYLDRDPSAPLSGEELARLQTHIVICDRCTVIFEEYRETSKALSQLRTHVDQESIARLSDSLEKHTLED